MTRYASRGGIVGRVAQNEALMFVQACLYFQIEKTFKKAVDKQKQKCYNVQADHKRVGEKYRRKVKKLFKNLLTREGRCGIIVRLSAKGAA